MALEPSLSVAGFPSVSPCFVLTPEVLWRCASTRVGFSRWNNANAEPHILPRRSQQAIEQELRLTKKAELAAKIASGTEMDASSVCDSAPFRSKGTPSSPSRPSIPGKKSKYSRNPNPNTDSHPAFRRTRPPRISRIPAEETAVSVKEGGLSYLVQGAPFEFQYSYTEAPKVKPLALREPLFVPFGPVTMPRPWTGRAPMPPSKKKLPEFDSFRTPPPNKKGVKPVQAPGPFLPGTGPQYANSREDVLGEPLTPPEIKALVQSCIKSRRQLSMGRDGLTHNMLDNIHSLWKRRRVCKVKCIGVCTVDMDNIRNQLEEKTGGKIIYSRGGVLYLFRGRNYNYRTRPKFPLMLWKPVTPVYPKLIRRVPEGLTLEEVTNMRRKGDSLAPICKLAKNGFYGNLINHVREAFEECELVRINCQGMNPSDYKKIGGKLKDLVPCVLISFEKEHVLMWRGREWRSSLPKLQDDDKQESAESTDDSLTEQSETTLQSELPNHVLTNDDNNPLFSSLCGEERDLVKDQRENDLVQQNTGKDLTPSFAETELVPTSTRHRELAPSINIVSLDESASVSEKDSNGTISSVDVASGYSNADDLSSGKQSLDDSSDSKSSLDQTSEDKKCDECTAVVEKVLILHQQAVESGMALILDDRSLDANAVYEKAVSLAKSAPQGPVFKVRQRKVVIQKAEEPGKMVTIDVPESQLNRSRKHSLASKKRKELPSSVVRDSSLGVADLAKLLG